MARGNHSTFMTFLDPAPHKGGATN
jgi:hypothetical protein